MQKKKKKKSVEYNELRTIVYDLLIYIYISRPSNVKKKKVYNNMDDNRSNNNEQNFKLLIIVR